MAEMQDDRRFAAFLFDMDGTILSSIASAERIWTAWAIRHGIDPVAFLPTIHGMRAVETVARMNLPGIDAEAEAERITLAEIADVEGIVALSGAADLLASLPAGHWAIVTSAPRALAVARLQAAGLPIPALLVTADDVATGKPSPEGYLLAADRLGVAIADCLVFEDAPAGIAAGEAAGASVLVVTACHSHPIETDHPTIADLASLRVVTDSAPSPLRIVRI